MCLISKGWNNQHLAHKEANNVDRVSEYCQQPLFLSVGAPVARNYTGNGRRAKPSGRQGGEGLDEGLEGQRHCRIFVAGFAPTCAIRIVAGTGHGLRDKAEGRATLNELKDGEVTGGTSPAQEPECKGVAKTSGNNLPLACDVSKLFSYPSCEAAQSTRDECQTKCKWFVSTIFSNL